MQERQPIRILVGPQRRLVHQPPHGEVRQQQAPELLPDQLRGLAAQHDPRPTQVRLQLVQSTLDFPPLVVKRRQGRGGRLLPASRYSTTRTWVPLAPCRRSLSRG